MDEKLFLLLLEFRFNDWHSSASATCTLSDA